MKKHVVVAVGVAALLLTGCVPKPAAPGPTLPPVPSSCEFGTPVDANDEAPCQRSGQVRWVVKLQLVVGVQITMAAGHLVYVGPFSCPDRLTMPSWDCQVDAQWRLSPDGRKVWIVSNGTAVGVDAVTGVVASILPIGSASSVLVLPTVQPPSVGDEPPSRIDGLVGVTASQAQFAVNVPDVDVTVQVRVGCVAGSEQDIPGVTVSHGAPNWAQICTEPVLYAINY